MSSIKAIKPSATLHLIMTSYTMMRYGPLSHHLCHDNILSVLYLAKFKIRLFMLELKSLLIAGILSYHVSYYISLSHFCDIKK